MTVVDQWTGGHARALQAAMRLTNEAFAEHLGISARTVAKWRERPGMVPSPQLQEALDTSLNLAAADTRARFASNLAGSSLATSKLAAPTATAAGPPTQTAPSQATPNQTAFNPAAPDRATAGGADVVRLDESVITQLQAAVGELARVLAKLTEPSPTSPPISARDHVASEAH